MGGFHLLDKSVRELNDINTTFKKLGIENVGPTHCTGEKAIEIFQESYKANCIDMQVGKSIEV